MVVPQGIDGLGVKRALDSRRWYWGLAKTNSVSYIVLHESDFDGESSAGLAEKRLAQRAGPGFERK